MGMWWIGSPVTLACSRDFGWIRLLFAGILVTTLVIALLLIQFYALDTERMRRIRAQLEAHPGTV
jgi:Na+/melibiose symporter-like transporter